MSVCSLALSSLLLLLSLSLFMVIILPVAAAVPAAGLHSLLVLLRGAFLICLLCVVLCCVVLCCVVLCCVVLCCVLLCCVVLCCVVLCCVVSCCVVLRCIALCCVALCYCMLCYVMLLLYFVLMYVSLVVFMLFIVCHLSCPSSSAKRLGIRPAKPRARTAMSAEKRLRFRSLAPIQWVGLSVRIRCASCKVVVQEVSAPRCANLIAA